MTDGDQSGEASSAEVADDGVDVLPDVGVDAVARRFREQFYGNVQFAPITFSPALSATFQHLSKAFRVNYDTSSWVPDVLPDARKLFVSFRYNIDPVVYERSGIERDAAALRGDQAEIKVDFLLALIKTIADSSPASLLRAVADAIDNNDEWRSNPRICAAIENVVRVAIADSSGATSSGSDDDSRQ